MEIEKGGHFPINESDLSGMVEEFGLSGLSRVILRNSDFKTYSNRVIHMTLPFSSDAELEGDSIFVNILKALEGHVKFKVNLKIYYNNGKELWRW